MNPPETSATPGSAIAPGRVRSPRTYIPTVANQFSFFATGALAGACTLPVEYAWSRLTSAARVTPSRILHAAPIYRGAIRFWIFDIARSTLQANPSTTALPVAVKGGLAGAVGGFSEVLLQALLVQQRLPRARELASQSSRLFFCFGSYTFLATTFSDELPPKPFWKCWLLGAAAGACGNTITAAAEGARGQQLWRVALPKGGLVIGTVISTQVTSCKMVLDANDE